MPRAQPPAARSPREAGASGPAPGRIRDEAVARLRARIGVPVPSPVAPHYRVPNEDAFRHFAHAVGDDNPLWCDPDYARGTRWGGVIAPPGLVGGDCVVGLDEPLTGAGERAEELRGDPLRGVHAFYSGVSREWWAPLRPGRAVWKRSALVGVIDKASEFAGRAVHEWSAQVFRDDAGTPLAAQHRLMIRTERERAQERAPGRTPERRPYGPEERAEIDAQYAREAPRGARPRYWEDVSEGDALEPLVKGPLTVTDLICWHVGVGMGSYGVAGLRLGYRNRQRIPSFYQLDELGVPDAMQRCHWDDAWARRAGNPAIFDYGRMRESWLVHLCTDWMGDDAWLWRLDAQMRRFNFIGDTHWMRGRVARRYRAAGDRPAVDLEVWGENQRGEVTTPGSATVLLPSRERGAVQLPEPPGGATTLQRVLDAMAERYAED